MNTETLTAAIVVGDVSVNREIREVLRGDDFDFVVLPTFDDEARDDLQRDGWVAFAAMPIPSRNAVAVPFVENPSPYSLGEFLTVAHRAGFHAAAMAGCDLCEIVDFHGPYCLTVRYRDHDPCQGRPVNVPPFSGQLCAIHADYATLGRASMALRHILRTGHGDRLERLWVAHGELRRRSLRVSLSDALRALDPD